MAASLALALTMGCVYPRPCKCICACPAAKPAAIAAQPTLPPSYMRQVAGTVQRMELRRTFEEELTLEEARQMTEGLANPEATAREGRALIDLSELEKELSRLAKP
jgi:hypothetical protein